MKYDCSLYYRLLGLKQDWKELGSGACPPYAVVDGGETVYIYSQVYPEGKVVTGQSHRICLGEVNILKFFEARERGWGGIDREGSLYYAFRG